MALSFNSHFFRCLLSKQTRGPEDQNKNQDSKNDGFMPGSAAMRQAKAAIIRIRNERGERSDNPNQNAAKHGAYQIANPAKHRRRESDQAKLEANVENGTAILQAVDESGSPGQSRADEEGNSNDTINIYPHQCCCLAILRHSAHGPPDTGAAHHPLQSHHQHKRDNNHQDIDAGDGNAAYIVVDLRKNLREGNVIDAFPEQSYILQHQRNPDGRNKGGKSRSVAQGTIRHPFDDNTQNSTGKHSTQAGDEQDANQCPPCRMRGGSNAHHIHNSDTDQRTNHENIAVGKVNEFDDTIDHRVTQSNESINSPRRKPDNQFL